MSDIAVQDEPKKETDIVSPSAPPLSNGAGQLTPNGVKSGLSGDCPFNDMITVYADNRLPHYDRGPVKAFTAVGTNKIPSRLFALICEDYLSPRSLKALNYVSILNPCLPRLVGSGVIDWLPAGKEKYCFIYENILGNALMVDDTKGGMGMKPEHVTNAIIRPMVSILQDLRDKDLTHGNIRPSNIFDGGLQNFEKVILGECLSTPPSYNQPALYETIERGMCMPSGRGMPTMEDDLYSFGVTLAVLLRHSDPVFGLTDEKIIERKMEDGSYMTLLGKDRFTGSILELLRGLLHDEQGQRWTLDDVLVWMDGRRLSPKQAARRIKAGRPLNFSGEKYFRTELIARDLNKNMAEAKKIIDNGELEQWLDRALEDKETSARFEKGVLLAQEGGTGPGYAERLVTRTAIALHPEGPIRYKSININPDGVGAAFTEAFVQKRDIQTYSDFFNCYFITQWVDAQFKVVSDISNLISKFDGVRAFLRQKYMGAGIEKCIYWLNPEVHCLSDKLAKYHVRTPEDMMKAFEKISKSPSRPAYFFDRHIAAFLSVKDRKNIEPYLQELSAPEPYKRVLAEIKALATMQNRSQMPMYPGITDWAADNLLPVYERYHDRELRGELKRKVEKLKDSGDLGKIILLFENTKVQQEDGFNFRKAMRTYYNLELEEEKIQNDLKDEDKIGQDSGHQVATLVSCVLGGAIIMTILFMTYGKNLDF